ncbi:alkylphosphonate utilization protein PhnN [Roseobacter sp. MED193]|uniref:phosphonate metabolism protein/1,5-bisphosphokinase (PRPP-forming) PhnN n=1 Tax=Roseobacter sp. MED193 TaxID=314262 RepID=UPI000068B9AF|nr:phosphonate metabolism protein/1,5-bisphosphokinase (PRPP-forming) PhnN [Roseobacter sp. MED193]EAQ47039.1 alkylphosphonate utilization protein PhnN [Roseobacter sp. MED193]
MSASANQKSDKGPVIAVVGPSGVGKDSLMEALAAMDPKLCLMRRVVTRAPEAGGEDYDAVSEEDFAQRAAAGQFALHWSAHGLQYGIPRSIEDLRAKGQGVLVNLSRAVLLQAQEIFGDFIVLSVTASPQVLAERLTGRGREDSAEVQRRLARASKPLPAGLRRLYEIDNSGDLADAATAARTAIYTAAEPVRA